MDNLLKELILNLGLQTNQLTIIKNADRFFYKSEVIAELSNIGVELVSGSALELRVHFEITFKANPQQIFCYLIGAPYCNPPFIHRAFNPLSIPSGEPLPTFASNDSP